MLRKAEVPPEVLAQIEEPKDSIEKDQEPDKIFAEMDQEFKKNTTELSQTDPA